MTKPSMLIRARGAEITDTLQKLSRMMMRVDEHLLIETTIGPSVQGKHQNLDSKVIRLHNEEEVIEEKSVLKALLLVQDVKSMKHMEEDKEELIHASFLLMDEITGEEEEVNRILDGKLEEEAEVEVGVLDSTTIEEIMMRGGEAVGVVMIEEGCRMVVVGVVENIPTVEGTMMEAATEQIIVPEDVKEIKRTCNANYCCTRHEFRSRTRRGRCELSFFHIVHTNDHRSVPYMT